MNRRRFLSAALGTFAGYHCACGFAADPQGSPRRIDMHHHFAPPAWVADVKGRPLLQPANTRWTPAQSLEDMDRGGVAAAVVSITNPGLWFGDRAESRRLARACNDYGAKLVQELFTGAPVTMPHIKAGRLKLLAVTDSRRSAALPGTPTVAESLPGYEFNNWYGVLAPAGTPRPLIEFLNAEVLRILSLADVRERFAALGAEPTPGTPEKFGAVMASDAEKWGRVIRQAGVRAD